MIIKAFDGATLRFSEEKQYYIKLDEKVDEIDLLWLAEIVSESEEIIQKGASEFPAFKKP